MAVTVSITTRAGKGAPLTPAEGDANFTNLKTAIEAAFALLGITLNSDGTVKANAVNTAAMLDRCVTQAKLDLLSPFYFADTGAVNALAIAPSPVSAAYADGQMFWVKVKITNTGAATLAVNGLAALPIKKNGGTDPAAGELVANSVVGFLIDNTASVARMVGFIPAAVTQVEKYVTPDADLGTFTGRVAGDELEYDHGLPGIPDLVQWFIVNQTTELGYPVGHLVDVNSLSALASGPCPNFFAFAKDATKLRLQGQFADAGSFYLAHYTTGASTAIDTAKWKFRAVAYYFAG